jgi:hypothetical protein
MQFKHWFLCLIASDLKGSHANKLTFIQHIVEYIVRSLWLLYFTETQNRKFIILFKKEISWNLWPRWIVKDRLCKNRMSFRYTQLLTVCQSTASAVYYSALMGKCDNICDSPKSCVLTNLFSLGNISVIWDVIHYTVQWHGQGRPKIYIYIYICRIYT